MEAVQIELKDYLEELRNNIRQRYPIPKLSEKYRQEERWVDDWHYVAEELPPEPGIYYCIQECKDFYNYTYLAYAFGHWWAYAGFGTEWLLIRGRREEWMMPFAWVRVPDLYYAKDTHYQFLSENFVKQKDWEYEQRMEEIRKANAEELRSRQQS